MGDRSRVYANQKQSVKVKTPFSFIPDPPQVQPQGDQPQQALPEWSPQDTSYLGLFGDLHAPPLIQAKLTVGAVGDKYEQEADAVAAQVVQQINAPRASAGVQREQGESERDGTGLQREEMPEEEELQMKPESIQREEMPEEEELQMKPERIQREEMPEEDELQMKPEAIQREEMPEEDELQMKPTLQRVGQEGGAVAGDFEAALQGAKGGGQALDPSLQAQMGQAMGADFSGVKVHTDAQSDQLNQSIQAKAFTTGQDVFFRQGAYEPGSRGGQELIAHELTHVVQQDRRLGQRMSQDSNDLMGATAVNTSSQNISHNQLGSITNSEVVQGYFLGAANNSVSHTVSEGQDRQADNSFRDPLDPTHTALATSGSDPTAANSLKISEDGKLAIENTNGDRQAKIFFAQSGVIDSSNKILLKKGSKYILQVATASAITVTDAKGKVHTLDAIEPVLNPDAGKKSTRKKVAPSLGGQQHGNAVQVEATCIAVAEAIMNKKYGNTATLNVKIKKLGALTTTDAIQWAAIVADAMTKNGKRKNGAINQDVIAQAYGVFVNQHPVAAAKIAKKLGVNEFASPKVGESYISESVGNPGATGITNWLLDDTGATDTDLLANDATVRGGRKRTGWGNHAGAVVATSAGNNITMENYARSGEDSTLKDSDNIFYFAMYGPASKPTQTWHAVWSGGATPIANAVTGVLK